MEKSDHKKGVIYIIASAFCFALMNLFIRLTGDVPTLQKCFFRNLFALAIAMASLAKAGIPFRPGKGNVKYMVMRSLTGGLGMMCNFYAVDHMDISDASMLNKLSPFFAVVFSALLLKEKANKFEWGAVICAFIGMLFVVRPSFDIKVIPALAGVAGGLGAGIAYTFVRVLGTRGEKSMIVVAFFSGFTTLLLLPYLIFNFKPMTPVQWMFLVLTGLAAAGGQIGITSAYSCAPAKEISVYDFSIVIFAAVFGFVFLGQIPDVLSFAGYFIIIGTALLKWYYTVIRPAKAEKA
ncbi:DMT family transporter [Ruminococcus sp. HUN007]|uniref:DMT family transporter n=1 Tax=Ruminococcus sp. HUN007 TaxID=1514668 RepID=UPI0005D1EBBF|nr:DMT family transporter [Ruminococcus sp. HUN007]